jgi:hypothetical protein
VAASGSVEGTGEAVAARELVIPVAAPPSSGNVHWLGRKIDKDGNDTNAPAMGFAGPGERVPANARFWCREGDAVWTRIPQEG